MPDSVIVQNSSKVPTRIVIVAGTYDGVLVGWDTRQEEDEEENGKEGEEKALKMSFAFTAHEGSVRALCIANSSTKQQPGQVISAGYIDESLILLDLHKNQQVGEAKLPMELGTPLCIALAPWSAPTHALVGTSSGKIAMYSLGDDNNATTNNDMNKKKKSMNHNHWNIVHILSGHSTTTNNSNTGVSCIATHPSGKLALSSGNRDSTICVWDLTKGRLAHIHKLPTSTNSKKKNISNIVWSEDGIYFAFSYESHVCVRHATTGEDLLDTDLNTSNDNNNKTQRVNDMCFLSSFSSYAFLAAVCDDGSLPVFCIDPVASTRVRAIMAIQGVDRIVVGTDRLKFIRPLSNFLVVTANTGGVLSIIDLEGAMRILLSDVSENDDDEDNSHGENEEDEEEFAAEILASVRVGSGARITNLAVWCSNEEAGEMQKPEVNTNKMKLTEFSAKKEEEDNGDEDLTTRARKLVQQAKKRQKKEHQKKTKQTKFQNA